MPTITFNLEFLFSVAGSVLVALVSIWGLKQLKRLFGGRG